MIETKFQIGDKVEAFGLGGVVDLNEDYQSHFRVSFNNGHYEWFRKDGRTCEWHKEPSLKLIERPKKKVTKTMYQSLYHYWPNKEVHITTVLRDEDQARKVGGFIALGPAITLEVEE